ncbi:tail protein [Vibrio phage PWH3a-P1]|uniref:tail protein n=1 Tax=Vibrio phage PWH3a-P1 TaxID=754058 RepID=UPI0002C13B99|nr:tail protein [Vibrio phage PWH3a-P1]AGH32029.1 hypothetical protein VPIG_00172 [Vibrio phage PWH3a-P1]
MPILNPEQFAFNGLDNIDQQTLEYFVYNPATDKLEASKSIETILASLFLGEQHKISSGGENIFFKNLSSGINYYPSWAGIKDQSILANQDITGLVESSVRVYGDNLLTLEPEGPVSPTNITNYAGDITVGSNTSAFGIMFRLGQDLDVGNIIHYKIYRGGDNTGTEVFRSDMIINTPKSQGDYLTLWFDNPIDLKAGDTTFADMFVESDLNANDDTPVLVYAADVDPNLRYTEVSYRTFVDVVDNPFSNDDKSKLDSVESGAQVNPDASEIKTLYESNTNTNAFTDAEKSKLASLEGGRYLGVFADLTALQTAHPTATEGDTATVTSPSGNLFYWDGSSWQDSGTGAGGDMLKSVYDPANKAANVFDMANMEESASEKIFTSSERTKLAGIETGAEVNNISDANATDLTDGLDTTLHYHPTDRARANHTGTQLSSTISDFQTAVSSNSDVTANTAKVSNATHTGEVTGDVVLTVQPSVITNKTLVVADSGMQVLVNDAGVLKKVDVVDFITASPQSKAGGYSTTLCSEDISDTNNYVVIPVDYTPYTLVDWEWDAVNNRFKYIGTTTKEFVVMSSFTAEVSSNSKTVSFSWENSGTIVNASLNSHYFDTSSKTAVISFSFVVSVSTNDYLELTAKSDSSQGNPTLDVSDASLIIKEY